MIPDEAVEAHELWPVWSVFYDTYKCKVCNKWVYQRQIDGEWKHGGSK